MSLKDKLKQRASSASSSDLSLQDLPFAFKTELETICRKERINNLFSGLHKEQFVFIGLTPGNRFAFLSFYPRMGGYLSFRDIEMILDRSGIVHGTDLTRLNRYANHQEFTKSFVHILIASGPAVVAGKSGYLELLKRPYNSSNKPDLETFDPVGPEDEIGVVHPPVKGQSGMTVLGEEIPPPAIQFADFRTNNFIKSITTEERTVLISTTKGYLSRYNQELSIYPELVLNEDLTVHRGNLIFDSDVLVKGNTQENVTMNIGGNLTIEGTVRQTQILVDGNLIIHKGIFGKAETNVHVGGTMQCRYINEVNVDVEGNIHVEKEILNSHTWTRSRLASARCVIVGGTVFAHHGLDASHLGSEMGLKTLVVVGLDKREYRIEHQLLPKINDLKERLGKAEIMYPKATSQNKETLESHILDLKGEIESRENEIENFKRNMLEQDHSAQVCLDKGVYPGVTIMIGDQERHIMERIEGRVTILRDGDNIKVQKGNVPST
jgi:uncharacterized protein (DUF342 family)